MDEMCFLGFYIYMYLSLLIDVATVSREAPVLVALNLIKSQHERACALNSIILEQRITFTITFIYKTKRFGEYPTMPLYIPE